MSLYPNRAHHIYKAPGDPKWKASRVPLATGLIDAAISAECNTFYGAYWGELTRFAVLDIDEGSKYHNVQGLERLRQNLSRCGLPNTCLYQSSRSGGWHLYIPLDDWAPSKDVEAGLKAYLKARGYDITGGQLEVFPSGNGLRLPLQAGFAWLDSEGKTLQRREQLTQEEAVRRFLSDLEANANDWGTAKELIESQLTAPAAAAGGDAQDHHKGISGEGFDDPFNCRLIRENYEKGRKYWREGLTEPNQRHEAVICIEHYLWHGDQAVGLPAYPGRFNDERRYRLIREWLETHHNGFCNHINAGDWATVEAQIKRACLWRSDEAKRAREYEPYPCTERAQEVLIARSMRTGRTWTMDDLKKGNEGREKQARKKIQGAVRQCLAEGRQVSRKTLQALTGCSPNTLRRHADLWKLFAAGSGDKNRGVQGGLLVLPGCSVGEEEAEKDFFTSDLSSDSGDLELDREEELSGCAEPVAKGEETTKNQIDGGFQAQDVQSVEHRHPDGNHEKPQGMGNNGRGKVDFILPYGAARRLGSASVPLRRPAPQEVVAAAQEALKTMPEAPQSAGSENVASKTSQKPSVKHWLPCPHAALPENHAAGEPVSMTGRATVYRLVIDTGGK